MLKGFGITVRYNVIKKKIEIRIPDFSGTMDNWDNATLTQITSLAALHNFSIGQIPSYIEAIGDQNAYNPVEEWITSKAWDGKDRINDFCRTLTTKDGFPDGLRDTLVTKWMLSLVAAALSKSGFHARGVLTLQGDQGIGKTTWGMKLVSDPELRDQFIKLGHHLDGSNKDSIVAAITHWIVEIGELDSSFRKDVARLKSFLTGNYDKVRRPYAKAESEYNRRTVFFATVNEQNFLVDTTGNSRFWTLPVVKLEYAHSIDMQQLYAQLAVDFNNGAEWWLTPKEESALAKSNLDYRSVNSVRDMVLDALDVALVGASENEYMTASELLVRIGISNPSNVQSKDCGSVLREVCGDAKRVQGRDRWRVPLKRPQPLIAARAQPRQPPVDDEF